MRDIREDLKERLGTIGAELDELKMREKLLGSAQQNLLVLLEDEERRFGDHAGDRIPTLVGSATPFAPLEPVGAFSAADTAPKGLNGTELPKAIRVSQRSWAEG